MSRPNPSEPLRPLLNIITFIAGVRADWLLLSAQEIGYSLMEINTRDSASLFSLSVHLGRSLDRFETAGWLLL